jgi:hypothetical protein
MACKTINQRNAVQRIGGGHQGHGNFILHPYSTTYDPFMTSRSADVAKYNAYISGNKMHTLPEMFVI